MSYENLAGDGLDYAPCSYGASKLLFRGPKKALEDGYIAAIGGTETYGKFVPEPFPELVEAETGVRCVNLGCVNAGLDVFVGDPAITDACMRARLTIVQVTGAQNMSNRFYSVHPRRNDRFLKASTYLQTIFREVDFTEFNFTRHMLKSLSEVSPERFRLVEDELRAAWVARMMHLLQELGGRAVLVWMAERSPDDPSDIARGRDPLYVDRPMLDLVAAQALDVVEVVTSGLDRRGMVHSELDAGHAEGLPGPEAHRIAASALAARVRAHL